MRIGIVSFQNPCSLEPLHSISSAINLSMYSSMLSRILGTAERPKKKSNQNYKYCPCHPFQYRCHYQSTLNETSSWSREPFCFYCFGRVAKVIDLSNVSATSEYPPPSYFGSHCASIVYPNQVCCGSIESISLCSLLVSYSYRYYLVSIYFLMQ